MRCLPEIFLGLLAVYRMVFLKVYLLFIAWFFTCMITRSLIPHFFQEVQIDATTMVPSDLYWTMLRAGEKAKILS